MVLRPVFVIDRKGLMQLTLLVLAALHMRFVSRRILGYISNTA